MFKWFNEFFWLQMTWTVQSWPQTPNAFSREHPLYNMNNSSTQHAATTAKATALHQQHHQWWSTATAKAARATSTTKIATVTTATVTAAATRARTALVFLFCFVLSLFWFLGWASPVSSHASWYGCTIMENTAGELSIIYEPIFCFKGVIYNRATSVLTVVIILESI